MTGDVLVLNSGSSSIKFAVFPAAEATPVLRGALTGISQQRPKLEIRHDPGGIMPVSLDFDLPVGELLHGLLRLLAERFPRVKAIGHRIVHGGRDHVAPAILDPDTMADLWRLVPLAPLHEPHNLNGVDAAVQVWPHALQVGCFDTAFHRSQPEIARRFAIPRDLHDMGIERYGFHGLSYEFIADSLKQRGLATGRAIVAHLGNGASMCAMLDCQSVATTMGMTPLDGLVMGTRSGSIDPGAVLHLVQQLGMPPSEVSDLLYYRSGLRGVSGLSADMRILEASDEPFAQEAVNLFAWRARQAIGALAASIGGLDVLVFTGGIGENSATMRARICEGMGWVGLELDHGANSRNETNIHRTDATTRILVLETDEEVVIARATRKLTNSED